ncbi:Ig-like domain-containing protein [Clostridium cylindrosporum]|uniref:BIG2 domain-containing protein n=1 Tax=Clostridium cylindrosporum DSM 605 TaxID=1121307 RepID=A0A0J8D6P9_CLOCY|nr:Ig-like domain-containing protein [Clostridium cylindrosporum]KMT21517.1 hypothetical protein CLCY_2c02780 [Clostridium cylindrosporum DSM 605]
MTIKNLYDTMIKRSGRLCTINTTQFRGVFKEIKDNTNNKDDKHFITDYPLKQGDIFTYNNINYFILNKEDLSHGIYNLYTIRRCIDHIKFNFSTTDAITKVSTLDVRQESCLFEAKTIGLDTTSYFNTVANEMLIILKSNETTKKVKIDQKILKFRRAWKVEGIDETKEGLIILHCKASTSNTNDDWQTEVADRWLYESISVVYTYSLNVAPTSISIDNGVTQQITAGVTENGTVLTSPTITYASNNTAVATVDANGLVSGVGVGTANITVSFVGKDFKTYTQTIATTINEVVVTPPTEPPVEPEPPSTSMVLNFTSNSTAGVANLKKGSIVTYTPHKIVGGIEQTGVKWIFGIDFGNVAQSNIEFKEITYDYIKLRSLTDVGTFTLTATELDTTNVASIVITLKPIY